jgi:hypothetical protein
VKTFGATCFIGIFLLGLLASPALAARKDPPLVTTDGLELIPDTRLALVYAGPDVDLSAYDKLLLMDAQVAFIKNWRRDINTNKPYSISSGDMQEIKTSLSRLFGEVFSTELETAGFVLSGEQADNVLIVRAAILDLNVRSPETRTGRTRNITESAGEMTLYLELRDSVTGDILVKALDHQFDRSNVTIFMQDSTRNERAARQILANWAQTLVKGLSEAKVITSGRQTQP